VLKLGGSWRACFEETPVSIIHLTNHRFILEKLCVSETRGLMEVSNNEYKISLLVQFDESCSVLVVNPEGIKPFVLAFEWLKV
jgi:hypothetical protein